MRKVLLTALLAALPTAAVADWEFTKRLTRNDLRTIV
jgi:hypothetical protein